MLNKGLAREFEKGLPGSLYYLWGEESCFLEEALTRFIDIVVGSAPRDFNCDVFDSSSEPQAILDAAATLPFMAKRRLVVLREFHLLTAPFIKKLSPCLREPSESTCMAIFSRKAPRASLKFNWKVYSLNIKERDIPAWLKHAAAKKGIRLTDDAVDCLTEFVGYDIGLLMMEIEKLALSGKGIIRGEDIVQGTGMMRDYTPFDLVDALITGQRSRAFRILKTIFAGSGMEAPLVLGTLNWHYRQFYYLWLNRGKRPAKMREKTYKALVKHLPAFTEEDFYRIFRDLHEADTVIKTSARPGLVLEVLLIRLLQKGAWN